MPARPLLKGPNVAYEKFAPEIRGDFFGACASLYYIRPRGVLDPETGEEIETETSGLIPFTLWPEQVRTARLMLEQWNSQRPVRVVKVKPRQSGDSSLGEVWQFHHVYWGRQEHGITIAHHETTTASLYRMAKTFYTELPPELRLVPERKTAQELAFADPYGNSIIAQTAGYLELGHGLTLRHAHLAEIDRWRDQSTTLEGVMEAIPLAPGTSIYIESKAVQAGAWLHTFWKSSKRGLTGFTPIFTSVWQVPEYRLPVPADFEPSAEEREWMREFGATPAQIMWYRTKKAEMIAKEPWGGVHRFLGSYPMTDEQAFQSSGFCIFPDVVLQRLHAGCGPPKRVTRLEMMPQPGQIREVVDDPDPSRPQLWVWEEPKEDCWFSLGVDISDGVGQTESVVSVCKYPGYEQVAEWASAHSTVEETAYVVRYLAEKYGGGNTLIIPEINRNGSLILYILFQLPGSYTTFRWRYLDRPEIGADQHARLGWATNDNTKKALAQVGNMVMLRGLGAIRSEILYEEMKICVDLGPRWAGRGGKSDRVIAWLIAVIGAYLEFEGGSVGNIASDNPRNLAFDERDARDPALYDTGIDALLRPPPAFASMFDREDLEDR